MIRLIKFGFVDFLTFIVSLVVYYPLTLFLEYNVSWLGQQFYLPATIPAILVSLVFGYYANKRFTFTDWSAKNWSLARYIIIGMVTSAGDVVLLFIFVQFFYMHYLVGSVLSVFCMFVVRYILSRYFIWYAKIVDN